MRNIYISLLLPLLLLTLTPAYAGVASDEGDPSRPTQVMLSISGDPTTDYSVTWRTMIPTSSIGEIIPVSADPKALSGAVSVVGTTREGYGEAGVLATHSVHFTGLLPATTYAYRVGDGTEGGWSEWFHFTTAEGSTKPFSFLYFGDVQNDIRSLGSRTIREAFRRHGGEASFMLFAGDLVGRSRDELWDEFFDAGQFVWGSLPSLPVPGNHEYYKDKRLPDGRRTFSLHWRDIYDLPSNPPMPKYQDRFYSLDYQGVRFVAIDSYQISEDNPDLPQIMKWIEEQLRGGVGRWTIVFTHYPIYSCSEGRDSRAYRALLQPLLEHYQVDLVLQGHDHTYCRGTGSDSKGADRDRLPLYVVSVAGPKMYRLTDKRWADVMGEDRQRYQYIRVESPSRLLFYSYDVSGTILDAFALIRGTDGRRSVEPIE